MVLYGILIISHQLYKMLKMKVTFTIKTKTIIKNKSILYLFLECCKFKNKAISALFSEL